MSRSCLYPIIGICLLILFGCGIHQSMMEIPLGEPDLASLEDGSYAGNFQKHRWHCEVRVEVREERIDTVYVLRAANGGEKLYQPLVSRVIGAQSPRVDAVSGATISCNTCLKAIENALMAGD